MDAKTLKTLEYPKVLAQLAELTAFLPSREKALALKPATHLPSAQRTLQETSEARLLLELEPGTTIGGARDVREQVDAASVGSVLTPNDLLDIKSTLISARTIQRRFEKTENEYPALFEVALGFPKPLGLIDAISQAISERGEINDNASPQLGKLRSQVRVTHDRLLDRMQKLLSNASIAPHLQEPIVTTRDGRYVLPIRADARGRVKAVVHDTSGSGQTLFVEPLQVVELNNEWRELQLAVRDEERRILAELSDKVGEAKYEIGAAIETLAALDLILARARYAERLRATSPQLVEMKPKEGHPGVTVQLYQARHPLLDQETVVPVDLTLDPETFVLVITGPNTGGKTVTLKTVGLLALMAQSGLHIPAEEGSQISLFKAVFADIGDEQSIEQSLSTFSGHITNIIHILKMSDAGSLVIFDELGAGTDPQEGAALAQAILTHLAGRSITTFVATHYPELKAYAHATPGVVNASVEFDLESLRPTYRLMIGLPGRSNALLIAQRLGLPEELVTAARGGIDPSELRADDLLDEIYRQRDQTRMAREQAEKARREAEATRKTLNERLEDIEDERIAIINQARQAAQAEVDALQEEVRAVRAELARARQPLEALEQIAEQAEDLEDEVEAPIERQQVAEPTLDRPIRLGDKVRLRSLGQEGVVSALSEDEAELQIGNLRVRVELYELELVGGVIEVNEKTPAAVPQVNVKSPGVELSLRGQTVDEALEALDRYLDNAYMAGLPYVRIVHGKGTGKLREAVRAELKGHPHVSRFEAGGPNEGGDGVTVAFFGE